MTHADSRDDDQNPSRIAYVAELQCFLCGSLAGTIESDRAPLPARALWRPADGSVPARMMDWRQMRCHRCGGALFAESLEAVVRHDDAEKLERDVPRRGRPPKWLVEERRRKHESAESRP